MDNQWTVVGCVRANSRSSLDMNMDFCDWSLVGLRFGLMEVETCLDGAVTVQERETGFRRATERNLDTDQATRAC